MDVFSIAIRHLKTNMLEEINKRVASNIYDKDVEFILTVPAIWGDAAKMFMREAAVQVSFHGQSLKRNKSDSSEKLRPYGSIVYDSIKKKVESDSLENYNVQILFIKALYIKIVRFDL